MRKRPAIGMADLLEFALSPQGLDDETAALLGYERKSGRPPAASRRSRAMWAGLVPSGQADPLPPVPSVDFPAERPRLKLLRAIEAETLQVEPPRQTAGRPISDAELAVPRGQCSLPLRPLMPWARLAPVLKHRLGTRVAGSQLDLRKLLQRASSGMPLTELPRLPRTAWGADAVILWDFTPEMWPFTADARWLYKRLKQERGLSGLKILTLRDVPRIGELGGIPAGTPILAISAMGQFVQDAAIQSAWITLSRELEHRGHSLHALSPCPRARWRPALAHAWPTVTWDRGERPPRRGGMTALPARAPRLKLVERLLTLLSPASRIEPSLLREARLLIGRPLDAGTEWDAWHHSECWHALRCFGFQSGEAYATRLGRRSRIAGRARTLAGRIAEAIRKQHTTVSPVVAAETELRAGLSGTSDEAALGRARQLLEEVVERLRLVAMTPGSPEGHRCGLPTWFPDMVEWLSPAMRGEPSVKPLVVAGLALAYTWLQTDQARIPEGVDGAAFRKEMRDAALRVTTADLPVEYLVGLSGGGASGASLSLFPVDGLRRPQALIGRLLVGGSRRVQGDVLESPSLSRSLQLDGEFHAGLAFPTMPSQLLLESSHSRLRLEAFSRPPWASRFWQDRFGLAAEFNINNVSFVLRWIPPGRFLMGSPESEKGRWEDEGPQHAVTLSRGFWLGETPVTQGQWEVVVSARADSRERTTEPLKAKPSRIAGPPELPVEQVSWHDSEGYCQVLNGLLPDNAGFHLPTEAQWEYACRAGTQSAFHDGSACTLPEGRDPALNGVGWFDKNSEGRTHPAKEKLPNAWGLYDMHGNVWEWCLDVWDKEVYKSRSEGVVDPVSRGDEGARRVVRGGSWSYSARDCRAASRYLVDPGRDWGNLGLRLSAGQEPV